MTGALHTSTAACICLCSPSLNTLANPVSIPKFYNIADDSFKLVHCIPALQLAYACVHRPKNTLANPVSIPKFYNIADDSFKLVHCIPALQPGRLVAVQGAGLLRVPHVDPSLIAEKALAEADGKLSRKFMAKMEQAGVSG
jgi:hypothetical protein